MKKLVLSCSGGGIRGLASLRFLSMLERRLIRDTGRGIYDTFDMFVGTSIGGILVILISLLKLKLDVIEKYFNPLMVRTMMPKTFRSDVFGLFQLKPKYDGVGKRSVIIEAFVKNGFSDDIKLDTADKPIIVTSYNVENRSATILDSYSNKNIRAVDAADATSAAPMYYPSVKTSLCSHGDSHDVFLVDGGAVCNKPTMLAYSQAKVLWPDSVIKVFSVGTGTLVKPINGRDSMGYGMLQWLKNGFIDIILDDTIVHNQAMAVMGKNYMRVTGDLPSYVSHTLDDTSDANIHGLKLLGEEWFSIYGESSVNFLKIVSRNSQKFATA